jgi:hypothetical protein
MNRWVLGQDDVSTFCPVKPRENVKRPCPTDNNTKADQTSRSTCTGTDRPWFPLTLSLCSDANETIKLECEGLCISVSTNQRQRGGRLKVI